MAEGKIIPEFGAIVRRLRGDLSYERAAEKLRYTVSTNAIRLMETGKVGRERTVRALAEGFAGEICEHFGDDLRARFGHCDAATAADWLTERAGLGSSQRLGYGDLRDVYVTDVLRTARDTGGGTAVFERSVLETLRPTREQLTAATARAARKLKAYLDGSTSLDGWVLYGGLDLSTLPSLLDAARTISGIGSPAPPAESLPDPAATGAQLPREILERLSEKIADAVADRVASLLRDRLPSRVEQLPVLEDDLRGLQAANPSRENEAPSPADLVLQALAALADRHADAVLPLHLFRGTNPLGADRAQEFLSRVDRIISAQSAAAERTRRAND